MNMKILVKLCVILGFCLALISCGADSENKKAGPSVSGPHRTTPVDVYVIKPLSLEKNLQSTGNIVPFESVQIRPERSGKITSLNITESGYVKAGKVIAQIDDSELIAERDKQEINLEYLRNEVKRGTALLEIQGITEEEVDRIKNQVKAAESEIRILNIQIEKSKVKAPFSGVLGLRKISEGAYVTPSDVIVDIQQNYKVRLDFQVAEKYLSKVKPGQTISFVVAGSDEVFTAKVYAFSNEISSRTRTFTVRAVADNPNGLLKPGQFSKINLVTGSSDEAIMVPTDAVIPILEGKQVFLLKNGRATATNIETGIRQEELVEITEGIEIGDSVIVSALLSISDGALVKASDIVNANKFID